MKIKNNYFAITLLLILGLNSCRKTEEIEVEVSNEKLEQGEGLPDWTSKTHTDIEGADYSIVFPQNKVNRIDIVFSAENYKAMRSNLASLITSAPSPNDYTEVKPDYVACDFYFNETQWYEVGIRYKGNSSLFGAYNNGNAKLPLRLKFDRLEDDYSEIKNQRFYGFQDLALGSNYNDPSYLREKSATDLFRDFGVPAVKTAFYEVYVDEGDGVPLYYGLYTLDEVVFDTMLNDLFGSETGNCYKPEDKGSMFDMWNFTLDDFEKKTNEEDADWSDILELYDVLHSDLRITDEEAWKSSLESVFDVQGFLKYLAVNNTIQNWDSYGNTSHNYFLYHDPADGLIKWIVWDTNETFREGAGQVQALSLGMSEVGDSWPLISFLIDVDSYNEAYKGYLRSFVDNYYNPTRMDAVYNDYYSLIQFSANSETSEYTSINAWDVDLDTAIQELKDLCASRNEAVNSFLNN